MELDWLYLPGLSDYDEVHKNMLDAVEKISQTKMNSQIWTLEHNDVYTAGTSAMEDELLNLQSGISIRYVGRGGKFTYHGPGQKIIYLLINLREFFRNDKVDIRKFVSFIENWIINSLKDLGIESKQISNRVGIWVENNDLQEKIAAIGIRVSKGVTYHGVSINIKPNLARFNSIVPCGIKDAGVTSIFKALQLQEDYEEFNLKFNTILKSQFYKTYETEFLKHFR